MERARRLLRDALGAADGGDLETAREVTEAALAALSDDLPAPSLPVDGGDGQRPAEPEPYDVMYGDVPDGPRSFHVPHGALWDELYDGGDGFYRVSREWFKLRWTTEEERADEDWLSLAFGDPEDCDTSVLPIPARATDKGAHLYVTLEKVEPPVSSSAGDEAREALERARASVQDASEMQCRCTGYYRCLGCEREVAEAAGEALEDIDAALAALSSPLPGAGDGLMVSLPEAEAAALAMGATAENELAARALRRIGDAHALKADKADESEAAT